MEAKNSGRKINIFIKVVSWVLPIVYSTYMHFVLLTSKRVFYNFDQLKRLNSEGADILEGHWHQDALLLTFTFRNYNIVSMVSKSNFGEIMARSMKPIGFISVRGGSSMGGSEALSELVEYARTHDRIFCGVTVDGSRGPRYKVKKGMIVLAKETGAPLFPLRATAKRKKMLSTWDRMLVPLPFNQFVYFCGDPLFVPSDATQEVIEEKRQEFEERLMGLVKRSDEYFPNESLDAEYVVRSKVIQHGWSMPFDD